jgi:VWFA-related protein
MTTRTRRLLLILALAAAGCLAFASFVPSWFAQSQDQPQQSQDQQQPAPESGPKPDVGETVLVPKKTPPAAPVQPEKKPEKINPNEIFNISTTTNLVNLDVMVLDKEGNPIRNLGKKNFQVFDDGVPQSISNFGTAEAPMTVCLLIEFRNHRIFWQFLALAVQYAYQFVNVIRPKDWVAVVSFDLKPDILTDFTQDRSEVIGALNTLRIPGFSEANLFDALAFTLDRMKEIHGRKSIIVICTGIDTFSKLTYDEILKIVKASDTTIYPISIMEFMSVRMPGMENITSLQARNELNTIAQYSGGQAYFPRFEQELPSVYQQIAEQMRMEYSLGFVPTDPAKDGKFHKLKVQLVDDQGNPLRITNEKGKQVKYRVVARDGYYAPKS